MIIHDNAIDAYEAACRAQDAVERILSEGKVDRPEEVARILREHAERRMADAIRYAENAHLAHLAA